MCWSILIELHKITTSIEYNTSYKNFKLDCSDFKVFIQNTYFTSSTFPLMQSFCVGIRTISCSISRLRLFYFTIYLRRWQLRHITHGVKPRRLRNWWLPLKRLSDEWGWYGPTCGSTPWLIHNDYYCDDDDITVAGEHFRTMPVMHSPLALEHYFWIPLGSWRVSMRVLSCTVYVIQWERPIPNTRNVLRIKRHINSYTVKYNATTESS
jgi:hypothetical protein